MCDHSGMHNLYSFVHEAGDTAASPLRWRDSMPEGSGGRRPRSRPQRLNAPQSECWERFSAEHPSIRHSEEVAGRFGEGRWGGMHLPVLQFERNAGRTKARLSPTGPSGHGGSRRLGLHNGKR